MLLRHRPRSLLDLPTARPAPIRRPRPEPKADVPMLLRWVYFCAVALLTLITALACEATAGSLLRRAGPSPW